jgi:Fe-S-cluster containining protein
VKTSAELGLNYCNQCGECCRRSTCHIDEKDVPRIAKFLGVSRGQFMKQYVTIFIPRRGSAAVKPKMTATGCTFLVGNQCALQPVKPRGGREFECWTPQPSSSRYWWPSHRLARYGFVERTQEAARAG